jgi:branched-chain amino acid transport system ATP-binding protein
MTEALETISEAHRGAWRLSNALSDLSRRLQLPVAQPQIELMGAILDCIDQYVGQANQPKARAHLYRAIRLSSAQASELIDGFERELVAGEMQLRELRKRLEALAKADQIAVGAYGTALESFTKLVQQHIVREQSVLFPMARDALSGTEWEQLSAVSQSEEERASGVAARAQFDALISRIGDCAFAISAGPDLGSALGVSARTDTSLLEIRELYSHYGRIAALHGASLTVHAGRLVALVGANGAGKTTLLRTISGVQKATSGSIHFDGRNITDMRADKRVRLGICHVPEGRQVFGPLSVADNLRLGAFTGTDEKYIAKDLRRMYDMFPILRQKAHEPAGTLSGGQQQMLAIARALMGRPRLLLLDEPSMGLAPILVEEIFCTIENLRRQSITILLVEQNAQAALAIADDAYVMETGRIVIEGSGRDLLADDRVREAYLGV